MAEYEFGPRPKEIAVPRLEIAKVFATDHPAPVVMMDQAGSGWPKTAFNLSGTYSELFGRNGALPVPEEEEQRRFENPWNFADEDRYHLRFGEEGDTFSMRWIRWREANHLAQLLFEPPTDPEEIKRRQEILAALAGSEVLDRLIALKDGAYRMIDGVIDFAHPQHNGRWGGEYYLLDAYYGGVDSVWEHNDLTDQDEKRDVFTKTATAVTQIEQGAEDLRRLGELARASGVPVIRDAFGQASGFADRSLQAMRDLHIPFDPQRIVEPQDVKWGKYDPEDLRGHPRDLERLEGESLRPSLFAVGAAVEFARRIRDQGWAAVGFDREKPAGYTGVWNIERKKDGQVQNDLPLDAPITVLSGANTSGKSHLMRADFLAHLAAQATGHAPVESGNFRMHDSYIYLDRATTDNDLSAFVKEVKNWNKAFEQGEGVARFYVDEGFSTTSPEDQARLLRASAEYIRDTGGTVLLATHSEEVLDRAELDPAIAIYNLRSERGPDGKLVRYFLLQKGRADSEAIAASRAEEFPEALVRLAEKHLRGGRLELPVPEKRAYTKVESFTAEEREAGKQERRLPELFPERPRAPLLHLYSRDPDLTIQEFAHALQGSALRFGGFDTKEIGELAAQMILYAPAVRAPELLERQQLFGELLRNNAWNDINNAADELMLLDISLAYLRALDEVGINRALHPFARVSGENDKPEIVVRIPESPVLSDLTAAIAFLSLNKKILREAFAFDELLIAGERYLKGVDRGADELLSEEGIMLLSQTGGTVDALPVVNSKDIDTTVISAELGVIEEYKRSRRKKTDQEIFEEAERRRAKAFWGDIMGLKEPEAPQKRKEGWAYYLAEVMRLHSSGPAAVLRESGALIQSAGALIDSLRSTDSVYLHQLGNNFEYHLQKARGQLPQNDQEAERVSAENAETLSYLNHLSRNSESGYSGLGFSNTKDSPLSTALQQLHALCLFAGAIDGKGYAPVTFNETGEVHLRDAWSIFRPKDSQIHNTISLGGSHESIKLLTGPNGSGKTFHEKGTVAALMTAMATGFAPASEATMPLFDAIAYLDRVTEKQSERFSSFSQELAYWKELIGLLEHKSTVFAAVDEAFSATSPTYQEAFALAIIMEFLSRNQMLMLSTHNHDAVNRIDETGTDEVKPYFFDFTIENGKMRFKHTIQEGHKVSHALEVARTAGFPEYILHKAES